MRLSSIQKGFTVLMVLSCVISGQQADTIQEIISDTSDGLERPAIVEAGVVIGEPSGLSGKYWVTKGSAFDLGLGWSFADEGKFDIYGDYLFHPYYIPSQYGDFPTFLGVGAALRLSDDSFLGVRFPLGLQHLWDRVPIVLFAQLAPIMEIIPDIDFRLEGGLGVRFAFGREAQLGTVQSR